MNHSAIELFLRRICSHSRLDAKEYAAILALPLMSLEARSHRDFVEFGEFVDSACLVSEGLVGRFRQTEDGRRQFVSVHIPGELIDLPAMMMPQSVTALHALTHTKLLTVSLKALRDLGLAYPAIAAAFWRDCVFDAGIVTQWLVNVGRRDARARLAHLLCELALRYRLMDQSDGTTFALPMTQEQIGDAVALTPVHVNRTLQSLRSEGLVAVPQPCRDPRSRQVGGARRVRPLLSPAAAAFRRAGPAVGRATALRSRSA